MTVVLIRSVKRRGRFEVKWPGAGSLGSWWLFTVLQCPRSQIGSPLCCESALFPGGQSVSALAVGACLDGGGASGQATGNGNGKERAMVLVHAVLQLS